MMTGIAAHAQETVLETPALEEVLEFLLDIYGQSVVLRRQIRLERWVILLDELIEEGSLRAVAHIRRVRCHPNWLPCQPAKAT